MKIGLFGGSFDPVHLGHLLVAQAAREELGLDRLFFIPAAQSPFKPDRKPTSAASRLRLLRLALAGKPWCEIDEQELHRGGVSYTIDTVRDYARRFPEAHLLYLIGGDHVPKLPAWREADELARRVEFVAVPRPGQAETPFPKPFQGRSLKGYNPANQLTIWCPPRSPRRFGARGFILNDEWKAVPLPSSFVISSTPK
jgi:nicotinate-nucleotide adenylyltransferase